MARNGITRAVRKWFAAGGFEEVETAALQISPGNEAHLHAFATDALEPDGTPRTLYLHTSPEFACKKLLAAGETAIFSMGKVWRNRERGPLHHPEFTLLEWYRTGIPYTQLMQDCAELMALAAETAGTRQFTWRGVTADPFAPPEQVTVAEAFARHAKVDLLRSVSTTGETDRDMLAEDAARTGLRIATDDSWADIFSKLIVTYVEPKLGAGRATILCEYPVAEAALARPCAHDPRVSERFELYACGVELANAFGELTDPVEQRRRFMLEMDEKVRVYGERYPLDEDLLTVLGSMPPASGAALGLDRLALLATGARHIEEVLWSPVPR
jgi:lysyl-tRNA synthetase class 2